MSDMIIDYGCCDNCEHKDPDAKECAHGKPTRGIYGLLRCENWAAKKDPGKCCNNCGLYNPNTKICKVHKVRVYNNDVDTWHCSYWEPRKEKQEESIEKRCSNCGSCHPFIAICQRFPDKSIWPAENHTCEHWEPMKEKKNPNEADPEKKEPVFGGTSLDELKQKQETWDHRKEAVALDRGVQQGGTLEMLDTVFDIACQQVPACSERWTKLKTQIHYMLCRKWTAEEIDYE